MSRSYRKPIVKDKTTRHPIYNRKIRRQQKLDVDNISKLADIESYELSDPKTIINDYDVCDYEFDLTGFEDEEKYRRK